MAKRIELRRHTDNDGDVLTDEGARAALEIGSRLWGGYALLVSPGAQRATQTLACFAGAQLFVANPPRYGPGLRVAPHAQPNDGALEMVLLDLPRPRAAIIPALMRLRRGTHLGRRGARTWRSRSLDLVAHDAPVIADTTVLDPGTVRLWMMPGALPIAAPRA